MCQNIRHDKRKVKLRRATSRNQITNPIHLTTASDTVAFELDSKNTSSDSLPSIELDTVFNDRFEMDPDVSMPFYADDTKNRALNSKTISHLSIDLEHCSAKSQNPLRTSTGTYRVRSRSGDMSCLEPENMATRSPRLEQYFSEEKKWKEGFCNQTEDKTQHPGQKDGRLSELAPRDSTAKPPKIGFLFSKVFRK